jgi:hypothetical protein
MATTTTEKIAYAGNSAFAIAWLDSEQSAANHFSALVSTDITLLGISS